MRLNRETAIFDTESMGCANESLVLGTFKLLSDLRAFGTAPNFPRAATILT